VLHDKCFTTSVDKCACVCVRPQNQSVLAGGQAGAGRESPGRAGKAVDARCTQGSCALAFCCCCGPDGLLPTCTPSACSPASAFRTPCSTSQARTAATSCLDEASTSSFTVVRTGEQRGSRGLSTLHWYCGVEAFSREGGLKRVTQLPHVDASRHFGGVDSKWKGVGIWTES
jgi:hypothetical protein